MPKVQNHPASYRDPSGFVFLHEGKYYRQVNRCYKENYALLNESGVFDQLVKEKKLISHIEIDENLIESGEWYCTLLLEQFIFLSFPYDCFFGQCKDVDLFT